MEPAPEAQARSSTRWRRFWASAALAEKSTEIYTIASRCGVFAKSDIQPLINQGAKTEDIAASILVAVVNQTIAGLAQGRKIEGKVIYLGGPLTFIRHLRIFFDKALGTTGICPENSLYYVAMGSALSPGGKKMRLSDIIKALESYRGKGSFTKLEPLFDGEDDYKAFIERHQKATVPLRDPSTYSGRAYLGIDAGSTTIKTCLLAENGDLLLSRYSPNNGNPVQAIHSFLSTLYDTYPDITIAASASTGYGEDLMKSAFNLDFSLVETEAHFLGAKHVLTVNSGSSANLVAFSALTSPRWGKRAIRPGDEVITAAAGFPTTIAPIMQFGAIPVFVDVDADTWNVDVDAVARAITPRTKAVMLAHTLGVPFDAERLAALCRERGIWLVEDCCDALGARWNGRLTGSFGDIATLSFYPAHHITTGEGGPQSGSTTSMPWGASCSSR